MSPTILRSKPLGRAISAAVDTTGIASGQIALANGGTAANLSDPNADRLMFWDDSAGAVTWLTAGSGLSISGTTMTASGGGGGALTFLSSASPSAASSSSINSCFTGSYDNYLIVFSDIDYSGNAALNMRLRASGTDNTNTTYSYANHKLLSNSAGTGSGVLGNAVAQMVLHDAASVDRAAGYLYVTKPHDSAITVIRGGIAIVATGSPWAVSYDFGGGFANTTSFDGFTLYPSTGTFTGVIRVYGVSDS